MRNGDETDVYTALVICPLNTVLNWQREWVMWSEQLPDDEVYDVSNTRLDSCLRIINFQGTHPLKYLYNHLDLT